MPHNRIPLLGLVLLALTASAFIATQLSSGQGPQKNNSPLKMKVLRDKTHVKNSPGQSEIASFKKTLPQENERRLENLIPKHVPIKIKIKKEKEAGFKDLNNEKWGWEFELEVINTGTKPIYALDLLVMTDVKAASGSPVIFPLYFGRNELGDIRTKAEPTDIPIKPGESVSLAINPGIVNAWDYYRKKENRPLPKRLEVKIESLNFGDGTGYVGNDATPLPRVIPEEGGSATCRPLFQTGIFGWNEAPPGSPLSKLLAFNLPAAIWPVNFLRSLTFDNSKSSGFLLDTCCPGTYCSMLTVSRDETCYTCGPQTSVGLALCNNPDALCREVTFHSFQCFPSKSELEPFKCHTADVFPCGTPTPSPSPTPTPSPSPTPTPTPCPYALPSQCPGGVPRDPCTNPDPPPASDATPNPNPDGCPFGYEVSNGTCCVPLACPQPTPTRPACPENQITFFTGPPVCQWSDCFELLPNPSPTPPSSIWPEYSKQCVEYYWVWYVSYDGGKTWEPTGQVEYAGCYYV